MSVYKFRNNDEIGKLEAETDSYLDSCFYESNVYKGILNFDFSEKNPDFTKRIIVGRTGSGKTALLKKIANHETIKSHETIEAENIIFEHLNNNVFISDLTARGIDLRAFFKSLWIHVLLIKVITAISKNTPRTFLDKVRELASSSVQKRKNTFKAELANEYLEQYKENFFNDKAIIEISKKLQDELSVKLKSLGFGTSYSQEDTRKIQTETSSYVSRELLSRQKELVKILKEEFSNSQQVKIVISVDDLDKSWLSASSIRYDFINALLEAFRELLDIKSVKILISIRTDILIGIYNCNLRQDEKDKSLIYPVSWNKQEIREIIDTRINKLIKNKYQSSKEVTMKDIFNFKINSDNADDFILDRTMLRPRDAINFVNTCFSECEGDVILNESIVLIAEEKFYAARKRALITEWQSVYSHINVYLDCLSFIDQSTFSLESISEQKKSEIDDYLLKKLVESNEEEKSSMKSELNIEGLIKVWFAVGVIGIKKKDSLILYSSFDKPNLDITDMKKNFIIHPLFYRE